MNAPRSKEEVKAAQVLDRLERAQEKLDERRARAQERLDERLARAQERLAERRRSLMASLEITGYATDTAEEAWAAMTSLMFREGKPRFPAIASELDLSPPQALTVRMLTEPRAMGELAEAMHCDNSNMTGIVDRLEERGLVQRLAAEHDRRIKLIAATAKGAKLREELNRRLAQAPEPLRRLSAADQRALRDILRKALDQ